MVRRPLVLAFVTSLITSTSHAGDLTIATFNTESDPDTEPVKVAETIGTLGEFDIPAIQEVDGVPAVVLYANEAAKNQGGRWRYVVSESAVYEDREPDLLGIVFNAEKFRQISTSEYHAIRSRPDGTLYGTHDWGLRGALILRLQDIASGVEFQVVTIHLKCCNAPGVRVHQAALLARQLNALDVATILLGDTNIPIEPGAGGASGADSEAFESLSSGSGLVWIPPTNPVKTQCSPQYNSMLAQIYGPTGFERRATAEVQFTEASYCDLDALGYSDHRPVVAVFPGILSAAPASAPGQSTLDESAEEDAEFVRQRASRPGDSVGE